MRAVLRKPFLVLLGLTAALLLAYGLIRLYDLTEKSAAAAEERTALSTAVQVQGEQLDEQVQTSEVLARQVESLGEEPIVDPTPSAPVIIVGQPGQRGEPGPPPSDTALLAAVMEFCEKAGVCEGEDGADSTVPGPPGPAGKDGKDGADSDVPGPPGADGTDGKDAPRIVGISCTATLPNGFRFVFTFDDGTDVVVRCET